MSIWPVIQRELLCESRRPWNHWLRVIAGAVVLAALMTQWLHSRLVPGNGGTVFGAINSLIYFSIWIFVPFLVADSISVERREGTLGLLRLTALTGSGIVQGKAWAHFVRAMTMLFAAVPVLAVCFIAGGVAWQDAAVSMAMNLSALLMALSAGILASARCEQRHRAMVLAGFGAIAFMFLAALFLSCLRTLNFGGLPLSLDLLYADLVHLGAGIDSSSRAAFQRANLLVLSGMNLFLCAVTLFLSMRVAGRWVERHWREEPPSARRLKWERTFVQPRYWIGLLRSRTRRALDRNPIGWLQEYSTGARMTKWGWFLLIVIAEIMMLEDAPDSIHDSNIRLALFFALALGFSAAGSFMRERRTGAMELILVTPLSTSQIIRGRLFGIWRQFLPGFLLLTFCAIFGYWFIEHSRSYFRKQGFEVLLWGLPWIGAFLNIPLIGLNASLRNRNFVTAWIVTAYCGLIVPSLVSAFFPPIFYRFGMSRWIGYFGGSVLVILLVQTWLARRAWKQLKQNLEERRFAMTR